MKHVNPFLAAAKSGRNAVSAIGGQQNHFVVDLTEAADVVIESGWRNCRGVVADVAGTIRVTYTGDNSVARTETRYLNAGQVWLVNDVQTVYYQYGTTPASCDAQAYTDVGDIVTGIKLIY